MRDTALDRETYRDRTQEGLGIFRGILYEYRNVDFVALLGASPKPL